MGRLVGGTDLDSPNDPDSPNASDDSHSLGVPMANEIMALLAAVTSVTVPGGSPNQLRPWASAVVTSSGAPGVRGVADDDAVAAPSCSGGVRSSRHRWAEHGRV